MKKMLINFELKFDNLVSEVTGNHKKIEIDSVLGVFYGLSQDGLPRLAFASTSASPKLESTRMLRVTQGPESDLIYWTCFDLLQPDAKKVFCTFCSNLVESIEGFVDESSAFLALKRRYIIWKTMFKSNPDNLISRDKIQGLFGELFFLKNVLMKDCSPKVAIQSWGGANGNSKDFSIQNTWYEIKTVGANASAVKISSLAQLESENEGHLVVIKVESMAPPFNKEDSCIGDMISAILSNINDETTEGIFLSKVSNYGVGFSDELFSVKFDVKSLSIYKVDDSFPRLTNYNIQYKEICDATYSLTINMLKPYLEG